MCERLTFSTYDPLIDPGIKGLNIFLESFYPFKPNIPFIKNQSTDSNRKLINLFLYNKNSDCKQAGYAANNYLFKFNLRNTRNSCEICSKLTIKTSEQRQ